MDENITAKKPGIHDGASLYIAILVMVAVAATLVAITFTIFLRSSAYETVKDIQASSKINGTNVGDYDTTSPVKTADIDETVKAIENKISGFDNQADYGPDAVTDSALGLDK